MSNSKLKLAFAGTPEIARTILESILEAEQHTVEVVFTQPDRPAGRGRKLKQSEVKLCALNHDLPVLQAQKADELKPDSLNNCDLMLVVAYGLLIPKEILVKPKFGCINIHTSLLPRWRGAAPIQRAIEAGDKESGISIMQMDSGLDTGPIIEQVSCPINEQDTGGVLHDRLAKLAAKSINAILSKIANSNVEKVEQDHALKSYANKISKQEAALDWTRSATELEQKIRAFNPFPVAHTVLKNTNIRIWEAEVKQSQNNFEPGTILKNSSSLDVATGHNILAITKLQLPGKRVISAKDFLNGHPAFLN